MSARQRHRLEKALNTNKAKAQEDVDDEILEEERPKPSGFKAFAEFDDDDDDDDSDKADAGGEESKALPTITTTLKATAASKSKKKKKNKNKQKGLNAGKFASAAGDGSEDELLDQFVEETKQAERVDNEAEYKSSTHRFTFSSECLDADREVRRKLGRTLSSGAAVKKPSGPKPRGRNARRVLPPGITTVANSHSSSIPRLLVTPEPEWLVPPTYASGEGARMTLVGNKDVYTFEASSLYRAAQAHYKELVQTFDPNLIIQMVQEHPFHIDSLLQLHDVFQSSGQNETAQMMLRRALFTLESWCSPAFRLGLGSGNFKLQLQGDKLISDEDELLKFDEGMDAGLTGAFVRALAISMRTAGRRDCYETAFNLGKMLLSLLPTRDPVFAMLSVDYYALQNHSYQWVLESHTPEEINSLPCVAYARALSVYALAKAGSGEYSRTQADEFVKEAIVRYPQYALLVLKENHRPIPSSLQVLLDSTEKLYTSLEIFDIVDRLCMLSFTRQTTLWSNDDSVAWLLDVCKRGAIVPLEALPETLNKDLMAQYAGGRVFDLTDKVSMLPQEELLGDEGARRNVIDRARAQEFDDDEEAEVEVRSPNVNLGLHNLLLLMQTALPWSVLPDRRRGGEEQQDEEDRQEDEWDDEDDAGGEDVE